MTKILLAGATGLVGGQALALLLADGRVTQVVAPTRRPLELHPKLLNPIGDNRNLPRDAQWWSVDGAISAIGTTRAKTPSARDYRAIDYDYALDVARHVQRGGAKSFALVTSMGANARSPFAYTRLKGALEEAVGDLGFPSLTIVRPGFLGGDRRDARPMERMVGSILRMADPILPSVMRISPSSSVAALLVQAVVSGVAGTRLIGPAEIIRFAEKGDR